MIRVRKKQNGLYTALRKMLDGGNLTYAWEQRGSKTIKIWSTKGGSALKPLVADVGNDVQATFLELFIEGAVVFATDLNATPEIRFFESGNPK
ncbi:MAG TPA: hypothetical protein VN841_10290 [Bryobacteraceae bacterium]|nr:hypothetical protein [Bryobacteraceae bacterium]